MVTARVLAVDSSDHKYDVAVDEFAVRVPVVPEQIAPGPLIVTVGSGLTLTLAEAVALVHPLASFTVTV